MNFIKILILCVFQPVMICFSQTIFVAESGNDNAAGTISKPLKTLEAALQKVAGVKSDSAVIFFREGNYPLIKTVQIAPADLDGRKLAISAYKNENVIISGAIPLAVQGKNFKDHVKQALIGKGLKMDQLFCEGQLMPMARYPNFDSTARVFDEPIQFYVSSQYKSR